MSYRKNIGHNVFTQALKIVFGMATGIIVARALGPTGQGYIAYIVLIFSLLGNFGHFGLTNAVAYFQKKSSFERTAIYSTNINLLVLIVLVISLVVYVLYSTGLILSLYQPWYIVGGVVLMVSTLFTAHHQSWLMGDEKIIKNNRIALFVFFLKTGAILLLWLSGLLSPASFFFISVVALLLWFIIIQATLGEPYLAAISLPVVKAEFSYGMVAWASALFAFLHYRVDQIMIKGYLGIADLGVYSVAVTIAELLFLFPISINSALSGRLYNLNTQDNGRALFSRTLRISIVICLGLCLLGLAGSFLIPIVYGTAYAEATAIMLILLPGVLFACLPKVISPWFFSSGRPVVHLKITAFCLLLNILLNTLLIPIWGSRGAALASSISYLFYGLYYLYMMIASEGFGLRELILLKPEDWQILRKLIQR